MVENLNSNNVKNKELNFNSDDIDYKNLITKLKEIKITIDQLEIIFR